LKKKKKKTLRVRAAMLCIWWDMEAIIHYEPLERNLTITAQRYCQQLRRLEKAIEQKRPGRRHGVILQHDNACKHNESGHSELDWENLPHPSYSPDLPPSDYHLFRSLANNLRGAHFPSTTMLSSKIGSNPSWANRQISSSVGSKTCSNVGRQS
jgi:hypothetical protein